MQINPSKSALQNFLNLLDLSDPQAPSTPDQVTTSNLQAIDPATNNGRNTSVEIDAVSGHGYTGSVTVTYSRLALADEAASPTTPTDIPNGLTDSAMILQQVADHYGFILSEISWVNANGPTVPSSFPADTSEQIKCAGSLVYQDGQATVNLHWQ
jgi:hypothetical protein